MECPVSTQDVKVNLKNRNWAIKNVGYGPANPEEDNAEYWDARAKEWGTDVEQAQTMRCGNCAAFIQTPDMIKCIEEGFGSQETDYQGDVTEASNIGYCEFFDFKCAGARTCSAWVGGGPVTRQRQPREETAAAILRKQQGRDAY